MADGELVKPDSAAVEAMLRGLPVNANVSDAPMIDDVAGILAREQGMGAIATDATALGTGSTAAIDPDVAQKMAAVHNAAYGASPDTGVTDDMLDGLTGDPAIDAALAPAVLTAPDATSQAIDPALAEAAALPAPANGDASIPAQDNGSSETGDGSADTNAIDPAAMPDGLPAGSTDGGAPIAPPSDTGGLPATTDPTDNGSDTEPKPIPAVSNDQTISAAPPRPLFFRATRIHAAQVRQADRAHVASLNAEAYRLEATADLVLKGDAHIVDLYGGRDEEFAQLVEQGRIHKAASEAAFQERVDELNANDERSREIIAGQVVTALEQPDALATTIHGDTIISKRLASTYERLRSTTLLSAVSNGGVDETAASRGTSIVMLGSGSELGIPQDEIAGAVIARLVEQDQGNMGTPLEKTDDPAVHQQHITGVRALADHHVSAAANQAIELLYRYPVDPARHEQQATDEAIRVRNLNDREHSTIIEGEGTAVFQVHNGYYIDARDPVSDPVLYRDPAERGWEKIWGTPDTDWLNIVRGRSVEGTLVTQDHDNGGLAIRGEHVTEIVSRNPNDPAGWLRGRVVVRISPLALTSQGLLVANGAVTGVRRNQHSISSTEDPVRTGELALVLKTKALRGADEHSRAIETKADEAYMSLPMPRDLISRPPHTAPQEGPIPEALIPRELSTPPTK